jgi:N-acetylglucosaminyldiphosphoundecaprenol N-acetyl-beta-D-mannosaminyltransferase
MAEHIDDRGERTIPLVGTEIRSFADDANRETYPATETTAAQPATGMALPRLESGQIIDVRVDATTYQDAVTRIVAWASRGDSKYVCVAAVNNVMEAHDDGQFRSVMNNADLVTPDGMPLVWGLRLLGLREATRVYGPDLTPAVLEAAASAGMKVGFYGGTPEVLQALLSVVRERWPELRVAYAFSPPFGPMSKADDEAVVRDLEESDVRILFVGLGCPKQELWMARHRDRLRVVMLGVGAAFDFMAGKKRQAPLIMQRTGTEWIFRLVTEPKRLWKRYLHHNPRFVLLFAAQLIRTRYSRNR